MLMKTFIRNKFNVRFKTLNIIISTAALLHLAYTIHKIMGFPTTRLVITFQNITCNYVLWTCYRKGNSLHENIIPTLLYIFFFFWGGGGVDVCTCTTNMYISTKTCHLKCRLRSSFHSHEYMINCYFTNEKEDRYVRELTICTFCIVLQIHVILNADSNNHLISTNIR